MGLFGFGKKRAAPEPVEGLDVDMDVPPKPPEFRIEGPAGPTPDELNPIEEIKPITPLEAKPIHFDDLNLPTEYPVETQAEVQQAIAAVRRPAPPELPPLEPLSHEEYAITPEPGPVEVPLPTMPMERPLGDSVLLREQGPLFVTLEGYEQMVANAVRIRADLQQAEDRAVTLNTMRNREDGLHTRFQQSVEQIERKLAYIDKVLFGESEG